MATGNLAEAIEALSEEKGIAKSILEEAAKDAILSAAHRQFGEDRDLDAKYNAQEGKVDLVLSMTVVENVVDEDIEISLEDARRFGLDSEEDPLQDGDILDFQIFYMADDAERAKAEDSKYRDLLGIEQARQGFGRIAAMTAKQVILQRVREAERERIFNEFEARKGDVVRGVVRRFERGNNIIVDLDAADAGRAVEALLPSRQQTPRENYRPGDRIQALLKEIDRERRGPQLILSRTDTDLLVKLFETEVPEIYEGIVSIVAAAREPGARSKIAVKSRDSDVDPVGACVGMKGSRVQAVVQELRGEKIDIVPFDPDPARFVCNAIAPAEVVRVEIDDVANNMKLVVPDAKLSLAIGRRGQNVRLADRLTGWKLDIISESRYRLLEEEIIRQLTHVGTEDLAKELYRMGFRTLDEVHDAQDEELLSFEGVDESNLAELRANTVTGLEALRVERIAAAKENPEVPDGRAQLLMVPTMTQRAAELLEKAGYKNLEILTDGTDAEQVALEANLEVPFVTNVLKEAATFCEGEFLEVLRAVRERQKEEKERAALEAAEQAKQQAIEAEAAKAEAEKAETGDQASDGGGANGSTAEAADNTAGAEPANISPPSDASTTNGGDNPAQANSTQASEA